MSWGRTSGFPRELQRLQPGEAVSPWAGWDQICKLFEEAGPLACQGAATEVQLLPGAETPLEFWSGTTSFRGGGVGPGRRVAVDCGLLT